MSKKELVNKDNFEDMSSRPAMKITIGEKNYDFLPENEVKEIEKKIAEINSHVSDNDGKGKSNEEKDTLYATGQKLWNELSTLLNNAKFGLILNKSQYIYMTNLLLEKMEYDVNLLFYAIELTNMLGNMKAEKDAEKYTNEIDAITYSLTATDITYLYHVLQQHKVKGLGKNSYTFANIIRRIGDISKIFAYYDELSKDLSTSIQDWVVGFEDNTTIEGTTVEPQETVEETK